MTTPPVKPNETAELEELYDLLRTARLNAKYYGELVSNLQRWNLGVDIAIAIGTSSTLAGVAIFKTDSGRVALSIVAAVAVLLSIVKPILNLSKRVERASKLWGGYNTLFNTLRRAAVRIATTGCVDDDCRQIIKDAQDRMDALSGDDDPRPNPKVLQRIQAEVNLEIPAESLCWSVDPSNEREKSSGETFVASAAAPTTTAPTATTG